MDLGQHTAAKVALTLLVASSFVFAFAHEARAQVQTKDQQRCIITMNKNLGKVASRQGKENNDCIKRAGKKNAGLIEDCLTSDSKGKVAKTKAKTLADFDRKCTGTDRNGDPVFPDFGATDPNTVNNAAVQKEIDLAHEIFGPDLDLAIVTDKDLRFVTKCQGKIAKTVNRCQDTKLREFNKCKKTVLRDPNAPADDPGDLEACMFVDPDGKVAKACGPKLAKQVRAHCTLKGVDLSVAFPGITDPNTLVDPNDLVEDFDQAVECVACLAVNAADGLSKDCDALDDGLLNGSCP